jgi:HEAT repeat protein
MKRFFTALVAVLFVPAILGAAEVEDRLADAWVVVEKGIHSGNVLARTGAATALGTAHGRDVSGLLQEALSDPQWMVRKAALAVLVRQGSADARNRVAEVLRDPNALSEGDVLPVVAGMKPPEARSLLLEILMDTAAPTRADLLDEILRQDVDQAAPYMEAGLAKGDELFASRLRSFRLVDRDALFQALLRSRDARVQQSVLAEALALKVKLPAAAVGPLLKSRDNSLRLAAAEYMAHQGDASAMKLLVPWAEGDEASRMRFARASIAAKSPDAVPALRKMLADSPSEDLLIDIYQGLAAAPDEQTRAQLVGDLDTTDLPRRAAAVRAHGRLLGNRGLERLHELLRDGNARVRILAAEAVGELGQAESIEHLERAVRDSDRAVRLAVVKAMASIRDMAVVPVASFLVYDRDPEIRKTAILAVCNANHESGVQILRMTVEDRDPEIVMPVLEALIGLDATQAVSLFPRTLDVLRAEDLVNLSKRFGEAFLPFLRKALDSERAWARTTSVQALSLVPAMQIELLKEVAATNSFGDTRRLALARLQALSCPTAKDVALALLKDTDVMVRMEASDVLGKCGDGDADGALRLAMLDSDEAVRVAAARNLLSLGKGGKGTAAQGGKGKR